MTAINKAGFKKGSFSYKVKVTSMVSGLFKSSLTFNYHLDVYVWRRNF